MAHSGSQSRIWQCWALWANFLLPWPPEPGFWGVELCQSLGHPCWAPEGQLLSRVGTETTALWPQGLVGNVSQAHQPQDSDRLLAEPSHTTCFFSATSELAGTCPQPPKGPSLGSTAGASWSRVPRAGLSCAA